MSKIRIIHIQSDIIFASDSQRFEGPHFENSTIILGDKSANQKKRYEPIDFHKRSLKNLYVIIEKCSYADIVVVHDLCFYKAFIVNRLPKSVIVIWRFFGLELYSKMSEYVYSRQTQNTIRQNNETLSFVGIRSKLSKLINMNKWRIVFKNEFEKAAFSRVNYFHGLSKKEYLFLKDKWPKLPSFLQISYIPYSEIRDNISKDNKLVIIGNNRSPYNNHLDILEIIRGEETRKNYKFAMLFNYGPQSAYTALVKNKAASIDEVDIIEDFLTSEQFLQLYSNASTLVINGHRQMAMGNIFTGLKNNIKIYLNEKNIILEWLREEGFLVFSIEDFISDLRSNKISLSTDQGVYNQQQYIEFTKKYNKEDFQKNLLDICTSKLP